MRSNVVALSEQTSAAAPLLDVRNLRVRFGTDAGMVTAVDDVSFSVKRGETLAVVGESGSGKSVSSLAIMGLLPKSKRREISGEILFEGRDLLKTTEAQMLRMRGTEVGMIFQEPMTSLNPVLRIGEQIAERLEVHEKLSPRAAWERTVDILSMVRIPDPAKRAMVYPHQMSGGMRQRVMIAMALACKPKLLIADEPTTALDVTIQAQILELMRTLQKEMNMAILFITHDLGVVAEMADRVVVMYAGRAVEAAPVREIFARPRMPYTRGLLRSVPRVDRAAQHQQQLEAIRGSVPSPLHLPAGCTFHPRCDYLIDACKSGVPMLEPVAENHLVRCVRSQELVQLEAAS
ncbi:ABC transporter ATP-binding protein [Granulicella cerasi]|uniref:ABC transporter ATP-binding protein n=1 Tax=Granulicella cerasi TaxID=741063 RepID=A0ABW1ZC09_9BACT|nr:ABC transporter ATP-binding protein [Granulicella cerasi]